MTQKSLPVASRVIAAAVAQYPTPFHLYDEETIRQAVRRLNAAFAWAPNFRNYFAVKATPNPAILRIVAQEGCGLDCSSFAELLMGAQLNMSGADLMFTSNNTPLTEYQFAVKLGACINFADVGHLDYLRSNGVAWPQVVAFRYTRVRSAKEMPSLAARPRPSLAPRVRNCSPGMRRRKHRE